MKIRLKTDARVRLVCNSNESSHREEFGAMCAEASAVTICVAYLKRSGFTLIQEILLRALKSGAKLQVLVGTDQFLTEPKALKELLRIVGSNKKASAFLVLQSGKSFHPKLYYVKQGADVVALVGSANITGGGLAGNVEASVRVTCAAGSQFALQLDSLVAALKISPSTVPLSHLSIGQYEARYSIFKRLRDQADHKAKKDVASLHEIDEKRLLRYCREYLADADEQRNRLEKGQNYREALKVLRRIAAMRRPSKVAFMALYERLVGCRNGEKLWHSGSVFRSKNKVSARRQRVVTLARALLRRTGEAPKSIYDSAIALAAGIPGVGPNIVTEMLNTLSPNRYAVLNNNPIRSLRELGMTRFPNPQSFDGETYQEYCAFLAEVGRVCGMKSLSDVDHLMNFIYWKYAKRSSRKASGAGMR